MLELIMKRRRITLCNKLCAAFRSLVFDPITLSSLYSATKKLSNCFTSIDPIPSTLTTTTPSAGVVVVSVVRCLGFIIYGAYILSPLMMGHLNVGQSWRLRPAGHLNPGVTLISF